MHRSILAVVGTALVVGYAAASCPSDVSTRQDCYPYGDVTQSKCFAHGCCWDPAAPSGTPECFHQTQSAPSSAQCAAVTEPNRQDCFPEGNVSEETCTARGCCYDPLGRDGVNGVAWCFFPHRDGYYLTNQQSTASGFTADLHSLGEVTPYGNSISQLKLQVWEETATRMHLKITDPNNARFEPPGVISASEPTSKPSNPDYVISTTSQPFGFAISRASTGFVMFNSTPAGAAEDDKIHFNGMTYSNQLIEFSTHLPSDPIIYGMGEHITPLRLAYNGSFGQTYTLLARDQGTPVHSPYGGTDLYASHPLYISVDPATGDTHGVFFFTAASMDVILQDKAMTYRAIDGVVDLYVFSGPTPQDVVRQYTALIGTTFMPPYWALGFHLCRWGYDSLARTMAIQENMTMHNLPQDVQWNDIDYMDKYLDFTTDPVNFPAEDFKGYVDRLHESGRRYMMIFDPGISSVQAPGSYPAWDKGIEMNVFINGTDGTPFIGKVWPGYTAWPDFFHPNASAYWTEQVKNFHDVFSFDGMWIDMNEPSNFCNDECKPSLKAVDSRSERVTGKLRGSVGSPTTGTGFDPVNPPYVPGHLGGKDQIYQKTIGFDAMQYPGLHYHLHNMYGYSETIATMDALKSTRGERTLVISRSTFPGSGVHGGHWLGDNYASWDDMYYSIPGILTFNMFGIPMVGADVCGFGGNTTAELCTRWMQLGALTPFYRNHNSVGEMEQAPYVFGEPYTSYIRNAMNIRYAILPYMYTLFHESHVYGDAVARALFYEFHTDKEVAGIDRQFLLGPALLVSPVLTKGSSSVDAYFPEGVWYDFARDGAPLNKNGWVTLPATLAELNVHIRGGYIVPGQEPALTTVATRNNPFSLHVALDGSGAAQGSMYLDDGVSLDTYEQGKFTLLSMQAKSQAHGSAGAVSITAQGSIGYSEQQPLGRVVVYGVQSFSGTATVNGQSANTHHDDTSGKLIISGFSAPVTKNIDVRWG